MWRARQGLRRKRWTGSSASRMTTTADRDLVTTSQPTSTLTVSHTESLVIALLIQKFSAKLLVKHLTHNKLKSHTVIVELSLKAEVRQSSQYESDVASPHRLPWNHNKDSHHRKNESSVHQIHPRLSDTGKTASKAVLIAPPDYRLRSSGRERSGKQVARRNSKVYKHILRVCYNHSGRLFMKFFVQEVFYPSNPLPPLLQGWSCSHGRVYSGTSAGGTSCSDGDGEDSDTGVELSELERCVLTLTHRRSQLRRQHTNAFLIAPPEFKIAENARHSPKGFLR